MKPLELAFRRQIIQGFPTATIALEADVSAKHLEHLPMPDRVRNESNDVILLSQLVYK